MLQAAVKNFAQLLALRFLAGAAEACADPSFMLITSMWVSEAPHIPTGGRGVDSVLNGLLVHEKAATSAYWSVVYGKWTRHRPRRAAWLRFDSNSPR